MKKKPVPVSEADYNRALKSLHVPFIEEIAKRIMEHEGDTLRYWDLRDRIYNINHLSERIDALIAQEGTP